MFLGLASLKGGARSSARARRAKAPVAHASALFLACIVCDCKKNRLLCVLAFASTAAPALSSAPSAHSTQAAVKREQARLSGRVGGWREQSMGRAILARRGMDEHQAK